MKPWQLNGFDDRKRVALSLYLVTMICSVFASVVPHNGLCEGIVKINRLRTHAGRTQQGRAKFRECKVPLAANEKFYIRKIAAASLCILLLQAALCKFIEKPPTPPSPAEATAGFGANRPRLHRIFTIRTGLLMATNRTSPRTPSKYQGNTAKSTQPQPVHKCQIDSDNTKLFLQLIIAEMEGAATRKHARTSTEVQDDAAAATNAMDVDSGMRPLSVDTPPHPSRDTVGENVVDSSLFKDAPPQSAVDGSSNPKRRKRATPGTVASSMDNLVEVVSKQSRELKITQYIVTGKGDNTMEDCLARLMSMPGFEPGGPLFSFACGIMDTPDNRDIIMALSQNYIVNWLIEKRACTPANVGRDHNGGPRLFGSGGAVDLD
ncbi:hypothetical protein LOK49_LG07G03383 [Camellia lanceoleosa]|uniref:Uncharacterized protein n=1 Tax=Camellia lanceoleosa TaxID=1840588 RepID=A0ACC0H430_9ERIC|nr:hypothetical protein LOK49_LG07G03383 [Camellia lanceoleosa]